MNIDNLFTEDISGITEIKSRKPVKKEINAQMEYGIIKDTAKKFEIDAFNLLFNKKTELGITNVYRHTGSLIDCSIETSNNKIYLVEFKYSLNWIKMCNARVQFQRYINEIHELPDNPPAGGLIIFNSFSHDWQKKNKKRQYVNGWYRVHEDQKSFEKSFKIRVLKISENEIQTAPFYMLDSNETV